MRYRTIGLMTAATGLIALGFAAPSQASLTTLCDGVASDVTVPGDLAVPAGKSCELTNVTINGNAIVRADANLLLENSTINGNLQVRDNGYADLVGTDVTGTARLATAYGAYVEGSSVAGNVTADASGFFYSVESSHSRNITSTGGETFLESVRLSRNLTTSGDALTDVYDSVIGGSVSVDGAQQGSVFCLSEVDGDASFSGNGDLLQIGASAPLTGCGFNVFGGNLSVTDNTAESYVSGNVIRGDFVCSGNDPLPVASDNRVRGTDSCEAATASAFASKDARGPAAARKAEVEDQIEERSEAGSEAAKEAGPAFE